MILPLVLPLFLGQTPAPPPLRTPAGAALIPLDGRDGLPVLLGPASREAILVYREGFQRGAAKAWPSAWRERWERLSVPCTLVVAFGSWCGDSERELPEVLALAAHPQPFLDLHFMGVDRSKVAPATWWPESIPPQAVEKVPTFWLFEQLPGGGHRLVGRIVENPPKKGQPMAEALLDLLEQAGRP